MHPDLVRKLYAIAVVFSLVALACSEDSTNSGNGTPACDQVVDLSVSLGTVPTFTWAPQCAVFSLGVELVGGTVDEWLIVSSNNSNSIAPPVVYGQVPEGAVQTGDPRMLEEDQVYQVVLLTLVDGEQVLTANESFNP